MGGEASESIREPDQGKGFLVLVYDGDRLVFRGEAKTKRAALDLARAQLKFGARTIVRDLAKDRVIWSSEGRKQ